MTNLEDEKDKNPPINSLMQDFYKRIPELKFETDELGFTRITNLKEVINEVGNEIPLQVLKIEIEGYILDAYGGFNNPDGIIIKYNRPPEGMQYKKYKITFEELPID